MAIFAISGQSLFGDGVHEYSNRRECCYDIAHNSQTYAVQAVARGCNSKFVLCCDTCSIAGRGSAAEPQFNAENKHMTELEAAVLACRKAFADVPVGSWVWCCHHEQWFEQLTDPAEERIRYILAYKAKDEQITRLNNFRPVQNTDEFASAREAYGKAIASAREAYDKAIASAREAYNKAPAWKTYKKVIASVWEAYDKAIASAQIPVMKLYSQDVPLGTWNGKSIFV